MNTDDPLETGLQASEETWVTEKSQQRQIRWEESVVKQLLLASHSSADAYNIVRALKARHASDTDEYQLTFADFHHEFPAFPAWLHCDKVPYAFDTQVAQLYKDPHKCIIYKNFVEAQKYTPDYWLGRPVGFVFEWLHGGGKYKVLHTLTTECRIWPSTHLQFNMIDKKDPFSTGESNFSVYLDNLDVFVKNLGYTKSEE